MVLEVGMHEGEPLLEYETSKPEAYYKMGTIAEIPADIIGGGIAYKQLVKQTPKLARKKIFRGRRPYAGGGLIKKGIQKLLESTKFNQSRRKFMKQAGATAAATALPTKKH